MKSIGLIGFICLLSCSLFGQDKLKSEGEIPILAWVGVPANETTVERYRELKESGININFSGYPNLDAVEKALNIAQKTGVKILFYCPELWSEPEKTAKKLMNHPALYGYHLQDEPHGSEFPKLGTWAKRIQSVDNKHCCYVNLFPNIVEESRIGANYRTHIDELVNTVPVSFLSFDHYPVHEEGGNRWINKEWYENLEIFAAKSKEHHLPFWAFSLSVAHNTYPVPTAGEIRLQMFSNLAYGAQGLQYFTYWTPGFDPNYDFHHGPIDTNGKRTEVYDIIKTINREIQNLSGVFLNASVKSVWHTGKNNPRGTRRIDKLPEPVKVLDVSDEGAIVSLLEKGKQTFLVIVNKDFQKRMRLTVATNEKVKMVQKDGSLVPANAYASSFYVAEGDMVIYTW
jgi:hypothetical protein